MGFASAKRATFTLKGKYAVKIRNTAFLIAEILIFAMT
jgi:hypothetical protein